MTDLEFPAGDLVLLLTAVDERLQTVRDREANNLHRAMTTSPGNVGSHMRSAVYWAAQVDEYGPLRDRVVSVMHATAAARYRHTGVGVTA